MTTIVAAGAASLASILVHGGVEAIAAASGGLPAYLAPLASETAGRYVLTFAIQGAVLVAAYLTVGSHLPGRSVIQRGVVFGSLVFLLGACLPLAPMVLVFRDPLPLKLAIEGLIGGAVVSFGKGLVFVVVWEGVARRLQG